MLQVKLISLLSFFISINQVWTYESFNDFPLTIPDGNYIIHATLIDLSYSKKYFLKEYLHSSEYKRGKISISSDSSTQVDVYYGSSSENQRLVIRDYDCDLFTYKTKWDKKIIESTKSLLNHILLVGPSLIYRLQHKSLVWRAGNDTNVRGIIMRKAYARLGNDKLNITCYYKDNVAAISQASRITFAGNDPSDSSLSAKENLILDIYLQTVTDEELDKIVIPKPGVGCPIYFKTEKNVLLVNALVRSSIHYISIENINGPIKSTTINEIYANENNRILSLKRTSQGITTKAIYDYALGIVYTLKNSGGCTISPMEFNAPGIYLNYGKNVDNLLRINSLVDMDSNFRHLGETWFRDQPGFRTDVWEAIIYNGTTSTGKYDKVVTTLFTVDSENVDTNSGKVLVGGIINAYSMKETGKYSLVETTRKDYYDFGQKISDEEYADLFRISDCYPNPSDRKTLEIHFDCETDCDIIKSYPYAFRSDLKEAISVGEFISASRIGDIEVVFNSNAAIAYVTFLPVPDIEKAFKSARLSLPKDVFKGLPIFNAATEKDCLKLSLDMKKSFEAVVYRYDDKACTQITGIDSLIEDKNNGEVCFIYYTPLENTFRYTREIPLNQIQDELVRRKFGLNTYGGSYLAQFFMSYINEVTERESKTNRQLYFIENRSSKLIDDGINTIIAENINNLADCYRACANLEDDYCETFSYCDFGGKTECLLSTSVYANITDKRVFDLECKIYRKNRLQDYIEIPNREFINLISIATDHWPEDCADLCSQSEECFSFQTCDGTCRFGGYYTDSSTKFSNLCNIYIPKLAQKFRLTGRKIITETYHTEMSLTLDQCAAICYDLYSDDGGCVSYNYCPKGRTSSSCSLSKYSVKDLTIKTSDSDTCSNYELIPDQSNKGSKKQNTEVQSWNKEKTAGEAFNTIMLFIAIGLVVGFTGPLFYKRSKYFIGNSYRRYRFNWNRQSDDGDEQEQYVI